MTLYRGDAVVSINSPVGLTVLTDSVVSSAKEADEGEDGPESSMTTTLSDTVVSFNCAVTLSGVPVVLKPEYTVDSREICPLVDNVWPVVNMSGV